MVLLERFGELRMRDIELALQLELNLEKENLQIYIFLMKNLQNIF